jgi:hypothetical protein
MKARVYQALLVLGMLCSGTVNTLVKKYAYDTVAEGSLVLGNGTLALRNALGGFWNLSFSGRFRVQM